MQCDHKKIIVVSICFNSASGYYTSTTIERFALGPNIYPHTRNEGSFPFSLSVFFSWKNPLSSSMALVESLPSRSIVIMAGLPDFCNWGG